jgi:hypothetical protein
MQCQSCRKWVLDNVCRLQTLLTVSQLLTRDPTRRLGSGKADAEEIKKHPFFKDVNFDDVMNKRIPPPYFPTIVSFLSIYLEILFFNRCATERQRRYE